MSHDLPSAECIRVNRGKPVTRNQEVAALTEYLARIESALLKGFSMERNTWLIFEKSKTLKALSWRTLVVINN